MQEFWKDISNFEGYYQVSSLGRIRNASLHVLAVQQQNSGYHTVHLYKNGCRSVHLVHRLVAAAFCIGAGAEVNHLNLVKTDNRAENLEWTDRHGNIAHAVLNNRAPDYSRVRHAVIGSPTTGGPDILFTSQLAAEKALSGRASSAIHHCLVGRKKSAYGDTWRRALPACTEIRKHTVTSI